MRSVAGAGRRRRDVNQRSAGDQTTPLLVASINGQFDIAELPARATAPIRRSQRGRRDAALCGDQRAVAAALVLSAAARAICSRRRRTSTMMKQLLDKGADPNARAQPQDLVHPVQLRSAAAPMMSGATPFWRAAYASDIAAMKMLLDVRRRSEHPDHEGRDAPGSARAGTRGGADKRSEDRRRCRPAVPARRRWSRRPAPATARALPATRIASRRPACWLR